MPSSESPFRQQVFDGYRRAGLLPLLEQIRRSERYQRRNGLNLLSSCVEPAHFDSERVLVELLKAVSTPIGATYSCDLESGTQGFSYGLNPYTDWAMAHTNPDADQWHVFLGWDWYPVTKLVDPSDVSDWFARIENPFDKDDTYWVNIWRWLLKKVAPEPPTEGKDGWTGIVTRGEAERSLRNSRCGLVFHNLIPYLRPAHCASAGTDWHEQEWGQEGIRGDCLEDLKLLRKQLKNQVKFYCPSAKIRTDLKDGGLPADSIVSWGLHPSYFYPAHFRLKDIWISI